MAKKKKLRAHPATDLSPHSGLQVSSCEALPPEQVHPQSFTHFESQPSSSEFPSSHRPAFDPITHEHQGKANAGQEEFNCSGLRAQSPASPRQPDARQGSSANNDAGDGEAAALQAQLEELSRAREEDKAAWLAEKQRLQSEATSLREQLQERTKLFKDALVSLDAKGTELEKLRRVYGDKEEEAKGKQYSMLIEELEAREQAHADELTAQAEEIINLQDEIKDAGAALEAKDSEVTQLRFQLMLVEKYYKEKREEHSNLVASMRAVEGIWERERSNAAQREQVLTTENKQLQKLLRERERQWETSFQQLMQDAVRREELLRIVNQDKEQGVSPNSQVPRKLKLNMDQTSTMHQWLTLRERQCGVKHHETAQIFIDNQKELRMLADAGSERGSEGSRSGEKSLSWLWSPSVTSSQSPLVSYQYHPTIPTSGTRTKSVFFDDDFLLGILDVSDGRVLDKDRRMASIYRALGSPQESRSDDGRGGPLALNLPPLATPPRPLHESYLAAIDYQHLPVYFQQLQTPGAASPTGAGDLKGDVQNASPHTRLHAPCLSGEERISTPDSTLSRVRVPFDRSADGFHGISLSENGPGLVLKDDISACQPPTTRPLTSSPAPVAPLSLEVDPDFSINSPTSVSSAGSDMKWSY